MHLLLTTTSYLLFASISAVTVRSFLRLNYRLNLPNALLLTRLSPLSNIKLYPGPSPWITVAEIPN